MFTNWIISNYMHWCSFQYKLFNQCAVYSMFITNYDSIMHTLYCYNHTYIKTIRDYFLLSFHRSWTIFLSVIIDSVLTRVTRGPLSAYIWSFCIVYFYRWNGSLKILLHIAGHRTDLLGIWLWYPKNPWRPGYCSASVVLLYGHIIKMHNFSFVSMYFQRPSNFSIIWWP